MFVVPFAPGGGTDAFARPLAAQLDQQLGTRVLIENKAGAGGTLGASYAIKQPADGYTFLIGAAHHTIAPSIYPKLDYDIEKDFVAGHHAGAAAACRVGQSGQDRGQDAEGIHRLHPKQPGQLRLGRRRHHASSGRRVLQLDGKNQAEPRALSRRGSR